MKKLLSLLVLTVVFFNSLPAWAVMPLQPIAPQQSSAAAGSITIGSALNLVTFHVTWQTATTARYMFIFDATSLPGNGAVSSCSAGHTTGCWLDCVYSTATTTAPNRDGEDYTSHPLAAKFGLVVALSTGAGCGTFTTDGANDFFFVQAY